MLIAGWVQSLLILYTFRFSSRTSYFRSKILTKVLLTYSTLLSLSYALLFKPFLTEKSMGSSLVITLSS